MGYLHIENLYKNQTILMFRECYALEKVHGTSAHIAWKPGATKPTFFSGGENHDRFTAIFSAEVIAEKVFGLMLAHREVMIYGEAYGGKQQGMRATYGDDLRFIAFDVKVGESWLSVPDAAQIVESLGLEFVPYVKTTTDLGALDSLRDAPSIVANWRGCGGEKKREGVVLRPLIELTTNNGHRVIAKHKCEAFSERATPQKVADPEKLAVLSGAQAIAQEWVTPMRLSHVLDQVRRNLSNDGTQARPELCIAHMPLVIKAMVSDVYREATGEVMESREATAAIGRRTSQLFQEQLKARDQEQQLHDPL